MVVTVGGIPVTVQGIALTGAIVPVEIALRKNLAKEGQRQVIRLFEVCVKRQWWNGG